MPEPLRCISSMATRHLLAELLARVQAEHGLATQLESVGGVDAAKRVRAGEPFDLVCLASDALQALAGEGHLLPGSLAAFAESEVALAVPAGAAVPAIADEAALRAAVDAAATIGYSTGPSGAHLQRLFARWGIAEAVAARTVQAPPGVPVASLVAQGKVALGFQQRSEMLGLDGIQIVGPLPSDCAFTTTFSIGIGRHCLDAARAAAVLEHLCTAGTAATKLRHGMASPAV